VAKELWLLRHGEAVPHGTKPDSERELTPKGERQARLAGQALARAGMEFTACYSSPKVRARDTARLVGEAVGVVPEEASLLAAGFDDDDADELLLRHDDGDRVLVVGHEPDLSQIVHDLTGARIDLKKGGIAVVRLAGTRPELIALLRPNELETMVG
jgi:phosphohistidine phosphatase